MSRFPKFAASCFALLATVVPALRAQSLPAGFANKGLVGAGRVDNAQRDKLGETFGSLSGLALDLRAWRRSSTGIYTATLYTQPDRGYVKSGVTTNYRPRRQKFSISFRPDINGSSKQDQLTLSLTDTTLYSESGGTLLTSLDPTTTGSGIRSGFPALPQAFNGRISLDAEGIALLPDGTFFVSDEYGPYLYRFAADGTLMSAIRPPEAFIPKRNNVDSFSSDSAATGQPSPVPSQPATGRANNKGFEGLAVSANGRALYTLLQSATRQDDGGSSSTNKNRYARLLAYDITNPAAPVLTRECVLPLPLYTDSGNTQQVAEQHDLVALNNNQFLVLAHDGLGRGADSTKSLYRAVLLYDLTSATNIAGTAVDSPSSPITQNGVLAANITPATSVVLININDSAQLGNFGLNNSANGDSDTLSAGWESLALAPALDATTPDDYFLLIGNDNDFSTNNGFQDGSSYNASPNIDTMVLVYRLTLPGTLAAPGFVATPSSATVAIGQTATFTAVASGNPAPTFQWTKNGTDISGATNATLTIASAQTTDAATYAVTITNANGSNSASATLTVNNVNAPTISAQPVSQTVATGSTVVFSVTAANAANYQWQRDGINLAGSTGRLLVINGTTAASNGNYTVVATNSFGSITSSAGTLSVIDVAAANAPRLINLSILTSLAAGETMTMGTAIGGASTGGTKPLLVRAVGPSLAQLGLPASSLLSDPKLDVFSGQTVVASNDNWNGSATLSAAFASVGAFAYSSATSLDAAVFNSALAAGNYTVQVSGVGSASGTMIAELYDATPAGAFGATTTRLINVSVLKQISATGSLTAGFVVGGTVAKTVLVRAIGPRLAQSPFNLSTAMSDPQLVLFDSTSTSIAANDNWGGDVQLALASGNVGAFAVTDSASKDAMLLITLAPGNYTARASSANATAGFVIVEVYEVP